MKLSKIVKIKDSDSVLGLKDHLKEIYKSYKINYSKFYKMDKLSKLGFLTSEILLKDLDLSEYKAEEISVIMANSSASLNADLKYQKTIKEIPSPKDFVYTLPNIVIGEISIRNNFKGESLFLVSEDFDTNFFYKYTKYLLEETEQKVVIMGWCEVDMNDKYESYLCLIEKGDPINNNEKFDLEILNKIKSL